MRNPLKREEKTRFQPGFSGAKGEADSSQLIMCSLIVAKGFTGYAAGPWRIIEGFVSGLQEKRMTRLYVEGTIIPTIQTFAINSYGWCGLYEVETGASW